MENHYLNIAMIGHKRIPSREGGVEVVVEELSTRMSQYGHKIDVYNRRGHHISGKVFDNSIQNNKNCCYKGVNLHWVPTINKKGLAAVSSSFFATIRALFSHYDCIHYHAEGPCAMLWIPHLFGIRTVATIHGLDWQRSKWGGFATWYLKLGEKTAAKYADEIIVLSKNLQQYFKDTYNRDTVYIPNGVEKPQKLKAEIIKSKWGLKENAYILYLGRLVPEKGLIYLIDAFKKTKTDKKLVIAGGTSDTDEFVKNIKLQSSCDDRIIFTGFVQGATLQELYSNSLIYCLPSDLEGMPLSLLEAMSYGNCCLCSNINEIAEVVEDKAVLFNKGDSKDLQTKLQFLLDNQKIIDKYKQLSSSFICSKYNWDDIVKKTLRLYEAKDKL